MRPPQVRAVGRCGFAPLASRRVGRTNGRNTSRRSRPRDRSPPCSATARSLQLSLPPSASRSNPCAPQLHNARLLQSRLWRSPNPASATSHSTSSFAAAPNTQASHPRPHASLSSPVPDRQSAAAITATASATPCRSADTVNSATRPPTPPTPDSPPDETHRLLATASLPRGEYPTSGSLAETAGANAAPDTSPHPPPSEPRAASLGQTRAAWLRPVPRTASSSVK